MRIEELIEKLREFLSEDNAEVAFVDRRTGYRYLLGESEFELVQEKDDAIINNILEIRAW